MYNYYPNFFQLFILFNFLILFLNSQQHTSSIFERVKQSICQPIINLPLCENIPYNKTIYPNPFIEIDQINIQSQINHFKPLIHTKCSPNILLFVCSAFAPMCPDQMPQAITSCKSVCEEVYNDCIKIFNEFDFPWPPMLNCSRFPSPPTICMKPEPLNNKNIFSSNFNERMPSSILSTTKLPECPLDLIDLEPTDSTAKCAFRCEKTTMFRKDQKEQIRLWLFCWSMLNSLIALFTVCSFWIDRQRFCFPERSIGFLAFCSLLSNIPHLTRPIIGFDEMAFSIAGNCWWLILGFTWYLSASRKWVEEEIGKRSILLHLFAWGFPLLLVIICLSNNLVDASELTGICSLGNLNPLTLFWFWIIPRLLIILIGFFLLLAGFSSMCKERNKFKNKGTDTSRLEKFLLKMGIFSLIYLFSILLNSLCDLHHLIVLSEWQPNTINCKIKGGAFSGNCIRPGQPEPKLYVFGQTMGMATGLAVGLCIFSPKTLATMSSLSSWKNALICFWPLQTKKSTIINSSFKKTKQQTLLIPPPSFPPQSPKNNLVPPTSSITIYNSQQNNQNLNTKQYIPLSILSKKETKNNEQIYEHQNVGGLDNKLY
uniref:Uncharacterized protein n=1 Tax=Meloidogyne enterolobii TaxID=390850 RepID=A0A6V7UAT1_MELEN|nr:unnamed protein product [Meloidogyne enterolobii]